MDDLEIRIARLEQAVIALSHVVAHHPDVLAPQSFAMKQARALDKLIAEIETASPPTQKSSGR